MSQDYATPSIFISHSSKDIQIARAVRNLLEDRDHFVGFFGWLQEMTDFEIKAFLDKEIAKHTWLILIDTDNAAQSSYVQFEIEQARYYGKTMYGLDAQRFLHDEGKTRHEVESDESLLACVHKLSKGFRIFVNHEGKDKDQNYTRMLNDRLRSEGFEVFDYSQMSPSYAVKEVSEAGIFIPLVSTESANIDWHQEVRLSMLYGGLVLPVIIEPVDPSTIPSDVQHLNWLDVSDEQDNTQALDRILEEITRIRHDDFVQTCGRIIT